MTPQAHLYVEVLRRGALPRRCVVCGKELENGMLVVETMRSAESRLRHGDCDRPWPNQPPASTVSGFQSTLADRAPRGMRGFSIERKADTSGVSGTGIVLEGVVFSTGAVVAHWLTPAPKGSLNTFDSWDQFAAIHLTSHPENEARVLWADGEIWRADEILGRSPWKSYGPPVRFLDPGTQSRADFDAIREEEGRAYSPTRSWSWTFALTPGASAIEVSEEMAASMAWSLLMHWGRLDLAAVVHAMKAEIRQQT